MELYNTFYLDGGDMIIASCADTREKAFNDLKEVAVEGVTYYEMKVLGEPIAVKTRQVSTLSRIRPEPELLPAEEPEEVPEQKDEEKEDK